MAAASQWEPQHLASELRRLNPSAAHLSDDDLLRQAAEDYPDEVKLEGESVATPRPPRLRASDFVASIRAANPDAAKVGARKLIMQAAAENPGSFRLADGFVHFLEPNEPAAGADDETAAEWQAFPPESGSLNVPRAAMPQIRSAHRGAFVQYLKGRGIAHSQEEVLPGSLKPSQAEFSPSKVEKARSFDGEQRSILISDDGHVADGHHQWLSSLDSPDKPIPAIRLHAPIQQLLLEAARFPSSGVDESSAEQQTDAQADIARGVAAGQQQATTEQLAQPAHQQPQPSPEAAPAHDRRKMRRTTPPSVVATHQPSGAWKTANERADFNARAAAAPAVSVNTGKPERNFASLPLRQTSQAEHDALINQGDDSDAGDARKVYGRSLGVVAQDAVTGQTPPPVVEPDAMSAVSPDEHAQALERRAQVDARDAEIQALIRANVEDEAAAALGMSRTAAAQQGKSTEFDFHVNEQTAARMKTLQDALAKNPELSKRTPQELANVVRDVSDLGGDASLVRNAREGAWSAAAGVKRDLGNAVDVVSHAPVFSAIPGLEQVRDVMRDAARRDEQTVQASRLAHPDEDGFLNEVSRAAGGMTVEAPKLFLTAPLGAAQLPVLGALSEEEGGATAAAKGAILGYVYHRGMGATAARVGRVGNALVWTATPTLEGMAEGKSPGAALASALPLGALAAAGGRQPVEVRDAKGTTRAATVEDLPAISKGELQPVLNLATGEAVPLPARSERGSISLGSKAKKNRAALEYGVDEQGNYTLRLVRDGAMVAEMRNVKPEELEQHLPPLLAGKVRRDAARSPAGAPAARPATLGEKVSGVVNLPRSVVTSYDVSAGGRQGVLLAVAHPVKAAEAFGAQLKAFGNEEYARSVQDNLTMGEGAERRRDAGLYLPDWEGTAPGAKEEVYQSQYAQKIPGVKASERAYNVFLNKLRADVFDKLADSNPKATPEDLKALARFINLASGRGELGRAQPLAKALAQTFFSPRFTLSRIQALAQPLTAETALARKTAAVELGKFFVGGASLLAAAKLGGAEVETDPRSTDFAKIKVGRTRIDIFGGYQQLARNLFQQITGTAKNEEGEVNPIDRGAYALRFGQSKLSPQAGLVADMSSVAFGKGEDLNGKPLTVGREVRQLIEPLSFRDIEDAIREDLSDGGSGVKGLLKGLPALAGVGVNTYEEPAVKPRHDRTADELRRLKLNLKLSQTDEGAADGEQSMRYGVAAGRVLSLAVNSESYNRLGSDSSKRETLRHLANLARVMVRNGFTDEAIDLNSAAAFEVERLTRQVNDSRLPIRKKTALADAISEHFRYATVYKADRRKLEDVRRVFERQKATADEWLKGAIEK